MSAPLFAVDGLTIRLRRDEDLVPGIDDVSFAVDEGEVLALVGESASGKSLMLLGSVDLLAPSAVIEEGTTTFDGHVLGDLDEADWRRLVGMGIGVLLQDAIGSWDPIIELGPQAGEVLREHEGLADDEVHRRVLDALGSVHLPKQRKFWSFSHEVSRGQAQRAMLAAALLSDPKILLADEPLSGLDVTVARSVLTLIQDLCAERGMAMVFVTHDLAVVASIADRVAVVYGGRIVEEAPVEDLYRRPRHPYTAGLLGSVPGLARDRLRPIFGDPPELWNLPPGCSFAPRCPHVVDVCRSEVPEVRTVGTARVACHRAEELELEGV
ncbi:MAG: ABC transporter ATP-binding protein [Acidimicrobiia bacterium]|nr:ABC transporter ATP-binding protein [Acidimicrobiia bacterium]